MLMGKRTLHYMALLNEALGKACPPTSSICASVTANRLHWSVSIEHEQQITWFVLRTLNTSIQRRLLVQTAQVRMTSTYQVESPSAHPFDGVAAIPTVRRAMLLP